MAATGSFLILAAALTVTIAKWWTLPDWARTGALVVYGAASAAGAAKLRARTPGVALVLAHLAALLAVPIAAAAMIALHQEWPIAVAVGGGFGVLAALHALRETDAPLLVDAITGELVFALTGVAAVTRIPLGVLVALVAAFAMVTVPDRDHVSVGLAVIGAATPLLAALGALGIGPGTAVRIGGAGDALVWAAPVAGVLAAAVLAVVARRDESKVVVALSAASFVSGIAVGLGALSSSADVAWWAVPGSALLLIEAITAFAARDRFWSEVLHWPARAAEMVALSVGSFIAVLALLVADPLGSGIDVAGAQAWALLATGCLAAVWRRGARRPAGATGRIAAAGGLFALATARFATDTWLAVGLVGLVLAVLAASARSPHFVRWTWGAALATWLFGTGDTGGPTAWRVGAAFGLLLGVALASLVALRRRPVGELTPVAFGVLAALTASAAATRCPWEAWTLVAAMSATAVLTVAAARILGRSPFLLVPLAAVALVGLAAAGSWPSAVVWIIATATVAVEAVMAGDARLAHVAAAAAPITALLASVAAGASSGGTTIGLLVAAVAVTGGAMSLGRSTPLDTCGASAALVGLGLSVATGHDVLASGGFVVVGVIAVLQSMVLNIPVLRTAGSAVATFGLVSLPITTGVAAAARSAALRHGVTDLDLQVGALVILATIAGSAARRRLPHLSSWAAYGLPVALAGAWCVATMATTGASGRGAAALTVGAVAVAAGGRRRLAAPLVLGTATIVATVAVAAGPDLVALPLWVWLAAGGSLLVGVALLIEMGSRPDPDRPRHLTQAVFERFE